jgi:lysophospholipase L1-like esterase
MRHSRFTPPIGLALCGVLAAWAATPASAEGAPGKTAAIVRPAPAPPARNHLDAAFGAAACNALPALTDLGGPISRTARRLIAGQPVSILAIGSSSTAGAGASAPDFAYPARLAGELRHHFPRADITVTNGGINGEETPRMVERLRQTLATQTPDLVIWQLGTNTVLRDHSVPSTTQPLREGLALIRRAGADVILVDLQFAPAVNAKTGTPAMLKLLGHVAKDDHVALFRRFAVMGDWHERQGLPFTRFMTPDGIHMNDWGYACFARLLANGIAEATGRTQALATAHSAGP